MPALSQDCFVPSRFAIVAEMVSRHYSFRRALAAGLALSFIWTTMACVSLCSSHSTGRQKPHRAGLSFQIESSNETDCCPITATQISSLPERPLLAPHPTDGHQALLAAPLRLTSGPAGKAASISGAPPSGDPPVERFRALRI